MVNRIVRKRYSVYTEQSKPILVVSMIIIFIILFAIQTAHASTSNDIDPTKLHLSDAQKTMAPYGANVGRIILYCIVIVIVIVTRLKWTKHGRKVRKPKIIRVYFLFSIKFYCCLRFILWCWHSNFISYSVFNIVSWFSILFLFTFKSAYIILDGIKVWFYLCKGRNTHSSCICDRDKITHHNIGLVYWQFVHAKSTRNNLHWWIATIVFDMLLMISIGLLIGINRRILIRYNLLKEGKEKISEK